MSRPPESRYAPPAADADHARRPGQEPERRPGTARLAIGVGLSLVVLLLGVAAKLAPVASFDLAVDRHIATYDRTSTLTTLAKAATTLATPQIVGIGLMIVIPLVLVLMRRRLDAAKVFAMMAGAFVLAEIGKKVINEHRPPASLWAMKAGASASYPSGHATTAAVLTVALVVIAATYAGRWTALALGSLYALAVAASRVYLADHYPVDVLGGMLCALAAAYIVTGLAALPILEPYVRRLDAATGRHR